jgi:hypothetical protein
MNLDSTCPYALKIFASGVNAIFGEPMVKNADTILRRRNLLANAKSMQNYIMLPISLS